MTVASDDKQVGTLAISDKVKCLMAILYKNSSLYKRLVCSRIQTLDGKTTIYVYLRREIMCPFFSWNLDINWNFGCSFRLRIASLFFGLWALNTSLKSRALRKMLFQLGHLALLYADYDQVEDRGFYLYSSGLRRESATGDRPSVSLANIMGVIWCSCVTCEVKAWLAPRILRYR
jgi:hypothetical protein